VLIIRCVKGFELQWKWWFCYCIY